MIDFFKKKSEAKVFPMVELVSKFRQLFKTSGFFLQKSFEVSMDQKILQLEMLFT